MSRSTRTTRAMCRRCTFTATSSPDCSRARCTWPIDADATGVSQNSRNTSSMGRPSSSRINSATASGGSGGNGRLQLLELLGQLRAHEIGPRAHDLAQLDERGAELLQGKPDARFAGGARREISRGGLEDGAKRSAEPQPAEPTSEPVLGENREDLAPAIDVAIDLRDGADSHGGLEIRASGGKIDCSRGRSRCVNCAHGQRPRLSVQSPLSMLVMACEAIRAATDAHMRRRRVDDCRACDRTLGPQLGFGSYRT